jgi:hypothetical protein
VQVKDPGIGGFSSWLQHPESAIPAGALHLESGEQAGPLGVELFGTDEPLLPQPGEVLNLCVAIDGPAGATAVTGGWLLPMVRTMIPVRTRTIPIELCGQAVRLEDAAAQASGRVT